MLGSEEGINDGCTETDGTSDGKRDGSFVGDFVGPNDGSSERSFDGANEGISDGEFDARTDGTPDIKMLGVGLGLSTGCADGSCVGSNMLVSSANPGGVSGHKRKIISNPRALEITLTKSSIASFSVALSDSMKTSVLYCSMFSNWSSHESDSHINSLVKVYCKYPSAIPTVDDGK